MSFLNDIQIEELTNEELTGQSVLISRGKTKYPLLLHNAHNHGMKGVVWRAKDDLGDDVALKIIPNNQYAEHSLYDEMTEATKLDTDIFARIISFGDFEIEKKEILLSQKYKAIVTKWVEGEPIDSFMEKNNISVDEFIALCQQIFRSLAILRNNNLCHDDLHPGNILIEIKTDELTFEKTTRIKIIDTGTIKRISTRDDLLSRLREEKRNIERNGSDIALKNKLKEFLEWKEPDDHLRAVESLLLMANSLARNYCRLEFWERKFSDLLPSFFTQITDKDLERRLDSPERVLSELDALVRNSKCENDDKDDKLFLPFDYISAEMIRNDKEFAELFSKECPWLNECKSLEPLYIYGPRGCGKSTLLRWLSFKTVISDRRRNKYENLRDIGVYVSCSVELRSRFWLLDENVINKLQANIIRYFNLLLLEELFETLSLMMQIESSDKFNFGFENNDLFGFTKWAIERITNNEYKYKLRLQGLSYFNYLKAFVRQLKWEIWADIKNNKESNSIPDPSLVSDVCRILSDYFDYFKSRHIIFLLDDYSNQRIPASLQVKLNQTISFAKQGTPIFKVSSEYHGVDLEGIQEGREVVEINIGERYTSLSDKHGYEFLADIINIRLEKANFDSKIEVTLGFSSYKSISRAILDEANGGDKFYYHGINCIHWLCSGDVALALDVIRNIYDKSKVTKDYRKQIGPHAQHRAIQTFSGDELRRIRYIVPFGEKLHDIVYYLCVFSHTVLLNKKSARKDKKGEPTCMTHLDIRNEAIQELRREDTELCQIYELLTSRAILFSLETSRSRISGSTERHQLRKIYLPAFKAPLKRDIPIKVDSSDLLKSLLSNPRTFIERELKKVDISNLQLNLALDKITIKPKGS